jgi:N-acetyl-anhydromuramyl-L-alanine amidase AmpD
MDYAEYAKRLKIVDVWRHGNISGALTDRRLYDRSVADSHAPAWTGARGLIMHGTAGTNSLGWLTSGTTRGPDASWASAHYLLPRDTYTCYKLVPDGYGCNHAGVSDWHDPAITDHPNSCFYGIECEDLQNWNRGARAQSITPTQHVKAALIWCYLSARDRLPDRYVLGHSQIAQPWGRRSDPEAGLWSWRDFWHHVEGIRATDAVWTYWNVPRWDGGR